ncbi:MAG: toxin HipA [Desulfuromonadales bacterium C00003093]|nr:MAG: toxin HipA [Desulfuromonadales bacterium C00003093]
MVARINIAYVKIWGQVVGAVSWQGSARDGYATFEYDPVFLRGALDLSPIHMPLDNTGILYEFRTRSHDPDLDTFKGLPGLLADSLPDKFGNRIIDAWLARQGRDASSFTPVERLCYTGRRGMGALEYSPSLNSSLDATTPVEISQLVSLAQKIISKQNDLSVSIAEADQGTDALLEILRVGTSAGGARAKAVVAMNKDGHILSGQATVPEGYDHWLLKFDGAGDLELGKTEGYGRIEYAYSLMARNAGIEMARCRLLEEGDRAHFMTKRFDRTAGRKIHLQSLCGIAHFDYNQSGVYGYEQAFAVMRKLGLSKPEAVQQFRRMVFNVVARNQDDHTKNIAFLMDQTGRWSLSPAFDVTYSHNPGGEWTNTHQMTINGKRDGFVSADFDQVGKSIGIKKPLDIVEEIIEVVSHWPAFAKDAGVDDQATRSIGSFHRLNPKFS